MACLAKNRVALLLFAFGFLIVIFGLFIVNFKVYQKRKLLSQEAGIFQNKLQKLNLRQQGFRAKISQTEQQTYLERFAREDFNLKRPGEKVVAFPVLAQKENSSRKKLIQSQTLFQKIAEELAKK